MVTTRFPNDRPFLIQPTARTGATGVAAIRGPASATGSVVVTSNANTVVGNSTGRIMHVANIPGHPHASLRTIVGPGQQGLTNSIQVMNLSVSNPTSGTVASGTSGNVTIKQAARTATFNQFPIETVNLMVAEPNSRIVNVKSAAGNTAVTGIPAGNVKITTSRTGVGIAGMAGGSTATALGPQTKVISLTTTNPPLASSQQQVTRLGIIQPPGAAATGKLINIAMPKQAVIINPSSHHTLAGAQVFQGQPGSQGKANMIQMGHPTTVMTIAAPGTTAGRHTTIIPAGTAISSVSGFTSGTGQVTQQSRIMTANAMIHPTGQSGQQVHFHHQGGQVVSLTTGLAAGSSLKTSSALISTSTGVHLSPVKQAQQQAAATPSSPRPSILSRKRTTISTPTGDHSCAARFVSRNLQQDMKAASGLDKQDSSSQDQTDNSVPASQDSTSTTPRKKPRKQLLEPFNLSSSSSSGVKLLSDNNLGEGPSNMMPHDMMMRVLRQQQNQMDNHQPKIDPESGDILTDSQEEEDEEDEEEDYEIADDDEDDAAREQARKPRISLLNTHGLPWKSSHGLPWKSLQYHFLRYTDVKTKPEKKQTLADLSSEGLQKKNGWKIHHLATQMEDMAESESEIYERLNGLLAKFEEKVSCLPGLEDAINPDLPVKVSFSDKFTDLLRGNMQRSNVFQEQINESRSLLIKLTNDHRERVGKVTRKNINKRTCISK